MPKMKNKKLIKGYGKLMLREILFLLLVVVFFTKVLFFARVEGMQMFPSLKDGDLALGYALAKDYRPGDVVVYEADGKQCFGRILTLAGNEVDIDGSGDVKVNGISESGEILYPAYDKGTLTYPCQVGQGSVFILGDYRTESRDSRTYGPVLVTRIKGKVLTILRRRGL